MTYVVSWGRGNRRQVTTVAELDVALDEASAPSVPQLVGIYPPEHFNTDASPWDDELRPAVQIGVGHADRSFVVWLGPEGGVGNDPTAPPWPEGTADIAFDYGGDPVFCGPDRARVTPTLARQAAEEFVRTGTRPTCIDWIDE